MGETIHVSASLRMEAPAEIVRQQYRDIDHHIRNNVHPGIRYQWEPSAPGERKIKTMFRILGVPQYDISLLEDAADGSFVIRYLEGTNAGMVLVHHFVPLGPNATEVQLSADAPSTPGRKLLGPLFVAGARQVMKRALAEDKADLEQHPFWPGLARGRVEAAFRRVMSVTALGKSERRVVLDAACCMACVDGDAAAPELDAVRRLTHVLQASTELSWLAERTAYWLNTVNTPRFAMELEAIGVSARSLGIAPEMVNAAAVIGLVSHGLSLSELTALRRLGSSAGRTTAQVSECVDATDAALSLS